jgi:hypothetical protein
MAQDIFKTISDIGNAKPQEKDDMGEAFNRSLGVSDPVGNQIVTDSDKSDMQDINDISMLFGGGGVL